MSSRTGQVAVFWDYENCRPPANVTGYSLVNQIREVAQQYGRIRLFRGYTNLQELNSPRSVVLRSELQCSGVSLIDCPHNGRKNVVDQMIIVDMLTFAIDNDSTDSTILLISGDRDFAYPISILRFRMYRVVVVSPSAPGAHMSLRAQASTFLDWNSAILSQVKEDRAFTDTSEMPVNGLLPSAPISTPRFNSNTVSPNNNNSRFRNRSESISSPIFNAKNIEENPGIPTPARAENTPPGYAAAVNSVSIAPVPLPPATPQATASGLEPIAERVVTGLQQQQQMPSGANVEPTLQQLHNPTVTESPAPSVPSLPQNPPGRSDEWTIPPTCLSLVRALWKFHQNGETHPLRSIIALQVLEQDKDAYRTAGVTKFRDLCQIAIDAKLLVLGGKGGEAWISLHWNTVNKLKARSTPI